MMDFTILNKYEENETEITEYTRDGKTVSHIVKTPIIQEPEEPIEPQPTVAEVTDATYLETQYQTILLEMMSGF